MFPKNDTAILMNRLKDNNGGFFCGGTGSWVSVIPR